VNKTTSGGILWCWLAVTICARAEDAKWVGVEPPTASPVTLKYEFPKHLSGAIYAAGSTQLVFQFTRNARRSGATLDAERDFTYPDGRVAARERVVYQGDALVSFELEDLQTGAAGSATIRRAGDNPAQGTIEFKYTKRPGARPKVHTETLRADTLMSDMVGPFLKAHWDALQRGEKVQCRFLVIPRRETVGFTFVKDSESTWQGRSAVIVKMQATSIFVAELVDPLFFTLEKDAPHRVLRYTGRTTPKIRARGDWKDLDAVTVFDWDSAR
jgi:hypothetical protein